MYESDTFEIIPANLTITVKASSKTYDGKVITYSVTQTGLKGTDTLAKLGTLTYTGDTEAKNAGEYTIGAIIEDGDLTDIGRNYNITYVDANFTINKRTLNVTANATNKTYDGKTETSKFLKSLK